MGLAHSVKLQPRKILLQQGAIGSAIFLRKVAPIRAGKHRGQFLQRQHTAYAFNRLTDREYGLSEVAEAIRGTEAKAVARPVITPEAE